MEFEELCEGIWSRWVGEATDPLLEWAEFCNELNLSREYCPEPYLIHSMGEKPLVFLTTNPGRGMRLQRRESLPSGVGQASYAKVAGWLAEIYSEDKPTDMPDESEWDGVSEAVSVSAKARIRAMERLAEALGYDSFLQVELIPLHSASLPSKERAARLCSVEPWAGYLGALKAFLSRRDVLAFGATGVVGGIPKETPWVSLVRETIGLEGISPWKNIGEGKQCWSTHSKAKGSLRAVHLMNGANSLPKDTEALRRALSA